MASYAIIKSDGTAGPSIPDSASPDAQTDLQLVGQNAISYGLDIAQSFYYLLENFAKDTAPATGSLGRATGQLWYDKGGVTLTPGIKVWNGGSWDAMAPTAFGTINDSTLRYNFATKKWLEATRVTISSAGVLTIIGPTPGNSIAISHDDTDLNIVGTSTVDINVSGVTTVNLPAITLTTVLDETYGGTGQTTFATGDVLYASGANTLAKLTAGANGEVLTLAGGVPTWASGGGAGIVTSSGTPLNNEVAVFTTGTDIDSDSTFTWDGTTMFATNVTGTNIGGIASSNLISRGAPGTISGLTTHTANIAMTAGDITFLDDDQLLFGTGTDVAVDFDGTNFVVAGVGDYNISGFGQVYSTSPVQIDNVTGESLRLQGNFTTSSLQTYIGFRDSGNTFRARVGIIGTGTNALQIDGTSDGVNVIGTDANTKITVANGVQFVGAGTSSAFGTATVGTSSKTSRGTIYNDINVGSGGYSIGYNETPNVSDTVLSSTGGTHAVTIDDIGLMLTKAAANVSATTIQFGTLVTAPVGASVLVHNDSGTGTCNITVSGMTLEWVDGSGGAAPTGTRALAQNSIATVRKKSGSVWQIWGNGLS